LMAFVLLVWPRRIGGETDQAEFEAGPHEVTVLKVKRDSGARPKGSGRG
jgi:hypothetical protein